MIEVDTCGPMQSHGRLRLSCLRATLARSSRTFPEIVEEPRTS